MYLIDRSLTASPRVLSLAFKWKDYRAKADARYKLMTLDADEFIRRFLIHVLPDGGRNCDRAGTVGLAAAVEHQPWTKR